MASASSAAGIALSTFEHAQVEGVRGARLAVVGVAAMQGRDDRHAVRAAGESLDVADDLAGRDIDHGNAVAVGDVHPVRFRVEGQQVPAVRRADRNGFRQRVERAGLCRAGDEQQQPGRKLV